MRGCPRGDTAVAGVQLTAAAASSPLTRTNGSTILATAMHLLPRCGRPPMAIDDRWHTFDSRLLNGSNRCTRATGTLAVSTRLYVDNRA